MKAELKILFYLKKNHVKKNGLCPVVGRIRTGKGMSVFSLKIDAAPGLWDTKAGRMSGKSKLAREVNRAIDHINLTIHIRYRELAGIHREVDADDLKNAVQGIASAQDTILNLFTKMNEGIARRTGIDYSRAGYEQYRFAYKAQEQFIHQKLKVSDFPLKALTFSYIEDYYNYLRVDRKLSTGTSNSYLIYFRKVIRNAVNDGVLSRDPFDGFEMEKAGIVHKTLTKEELDRFMRAVPENERQERSKDVFLFGTFTGLSYIDMKHLGYDDIKTMGDGSRWIVAKRQKTGVEYRVRLLAVPLAIIDKYKGVMTDGRVLDVPDKMIVHRGINAIAKQCGFDRGIGIHMSRHSFASIVTLSEGVPIETVSRMLGHKYIKTTQRYAELSIDKIREDMLLLSKQIAGKFTLIMP